MLYIVGFHSFEPNGSEPTFHTESFEADDSGHAVCLFWLAHPTGNIYQETVMPADEEGEASVTGACVSA